MNSEINICIETFIDRILGMMSEYNITLFDALLWDFEGFENDAESIYMNRGAESLERSFRIYLLKNGIEKPSDEDYYTDVFMGRAKNLEIKDAKT